MEMEAETEVVSEFVSVDYSEMLQQIIDNQQSILEYLNFMNNTVWDFYNTGLVILGLSSALVVLLVIYHFLKKFI